MSRAARALLLLLLAPVLLAPAAAPALGQEAATPRIPTERTFTAGPLDVTLRVVGDTTAAAFRVGGGDALSAVYNTNLTAGGLGFLQVIAQPRENDTFEMDVVLRWNDAWFRIQSPNATTGNASIPGLQQPCAREGTGIRCVLNGSAAKVDTAITFYSIMATPPGDYALTVEAEAYRTSSGTRVFQGRGNSTYDLRILDPFPSHASRGEAGETLVGAWVLGGISGLGGTGCSVGALLGSDTSVGRGVPAVVCVVAVPRSNDTVRVVANASGPAWFGGQGGWRSQDLTREVGPLSKPVGVIAFLPAAEAPVGPAQASLHFEVERLEDGAWVKAGEGDLPLPLTVSAVATRVPGPQGINWLLQVPVIAAAVAGLGYLAHKHRRPKVEHRSQAMRELSKRGKAAEATPEVVQEQKREAHEAAADKKRQILEAKREDILKSIRLADERKQRGEITEHVLQGIRERKMRQLEQVEQELRELGD